MSPSEQKLLQDNFKEHEKQDLLNFNKIHFALDDIRTKHLVDLKNDLTDVKLQTQKTNGSVAELKQWQFFIKGGLAVLTVLVAPILFIFIKEILSK